MRAFFLTQQWHNYGTITAPVLFCVHMGITPNSLYYQPLTSCTRWGNNPESSECKSDALG